MLINVFSILYLSGIGCWVNGGYLNVMLQFVFGDVGMLVMFDYVNEIVQVGYYGVMFGNGIKVELMMMLCIGFVCFMYLVFVQGQQVMIVIDLIVLNNCV